MVVRLPGARLSKIVPSTLVQAHSNYDTLCVYVCVLICVYEVGWW